MVSQSIVIDPEKKKPFCDVTVPLPGDSIRSECIEDELSTPPEDMKKEKKECRSAMWDTLSLTLILGLILTVGILAVRIHKMNEEIAFLKNSDEVELKTNKIIDHEKSVDVNADIDDEAHEKLRRMEEKYGKDDCHKRRCRVFMRLMDDPYDGFRGKGWWNGRY